jgi:hypothetical protein
MWVRRRACDAGALARRARPGPCERGLGEGVGPPYAGRSSTNDLRPSALFAEFSARVRDGRPGPGASILPWCPPGPAIQDGASVHLGGRRRIFDIPAPGASPLGVWNRPSNASAFAGRSLHPFDLSFLMTKEARTRRPWQGRGAPGARAATVLTQRPGPTATQTTYALPRRWVSGSVRLRPCAIAPADRLKHLGVHGPHNPSIVAWTRPPRWETCARTASFRSLSRLPEQTGYALPRKRPKSGTAPTSEPATTPSY